MMWRFVCVLLLVSCCFADDLDLKDHWEKFKLKYNKKYESKSHEEESRARFEKKVKMILKHNLAADLGEHKNTMGINKFTDMTKEEIASRHTGLELPQNMTRNYAPIKLQATGPIPTNWDWREQGAVNPVWNQGGCQTCWAFAATSTVESAYAIKTGRLLDLSEQQMVDCVKPPTPEGCMQLGNPVYVYLYLQDHSIASESCDPYDQTKHQCPDVSSCAQTKIGGYYDVNGNDDDIFKQTLYNHGPMSVLIYSSSEEFQNHRSGIFYNKDCYNNVDHAVVLVGYGSEDGEDYFILRNTWGTEWGENGYAKVGRNDKSRCEFLKYATYPYV